MITILFRPNNQTIFHAFYPFVSSQYSGEFYFTQDLDYCLKNDRNRYLVIASYFKLRYHLVEENVALLQKLKQRYDKIIFFDDSDGADSLHVELIEHVDLYFKKQLLKDPTKYLEPSYGRQQFSDYYYKEFNVIDQEANIRKELKNAEQLNKLHISWNIGAAIYPTPRVQRKLFNFANRVINFNKLLPFYNSRKIKKIKSLGKNRKKVIQARFGFDNYTPSIGHQRKLLMEEMADSPNYIKGRTSRKEFYKEMQTIRGVLSPFGWGEICHRDFEAIIYGCTLLKPDMEHVDTFPQIYFKNETYIPIKWDASDLILRTNECLDDLNFSEQLNHNMREVYYSAIDKLDQRVYAFIDLITSLKGEKSKIMKIAG